MITVHYLLRFNSKKRIQKNFQKKKVRKLLVIIGTAIMIPASSASAASKIQIDCDNSLYTYLKTEHSDDSCEEIFWDGFIEGNGDQIQRVLQNQRTCSHNYVNGMLQKHQKNGDGCVYMIYHAKRCTKCGLTMVGTLQDKIIYEKCPH